MPILQHILLGVLLGRSMVLASFDYVFWPFLGSPIDSLKSKVPLTTRNSMISFYKSLDATPPNFDYFLAVSCLLLILSFLGGIVQNKNRVQSTLCLVLFSAAVGVELLLSRGIQRDLITKTSGSKPLENLYNLAMNHGITFAMLIASALLQISTEKEEVEQIERFDSDGKKKKE